MAKRSKNRKGTAAAPQKAPLETPWDTEKFENVHQIGGIQTALLTPQFGGDAANGVRVAQVNTGSGLRFTVALDRGGDIVEAFFNQHSLVYLSPNGLRPPSHAYNRDLEWLRNWPGGLVTTCGPLHIGHPREVDGIQHPLHGHFSNIPATVEMVLNPDPHTGRREMLLSMVIQDSCMFGPTVQIRRQIQCALGRSHIFIYDQVTNRGNTRVPHHWLYHVNIGYPLLDHGARFIYRGKAQYWQDRAMSGKPPSTAALNRLKRVTAPLPEHAGAGERGVLVEVEPDKDGRCHVGLINSKLGLALELAYSSNCLPRIGNWQHYGPRGSYVSGIEPFNGSLLGLDTDDYPNAELFLEPGQTMRYQLEIKVHADRQSIAAFAKHDGRLK